MNIPYTSKNPNDEMLVSSKEEFADDYVMKKDDFAKYFNEKLNELNEKFEIPLSKKDIAEKLDISYEQFRKIVNREKPAKKRDCIIAIAALLGLDTDDTNLALKYNGKMQELNAWNIRDEIIMTILEDHRKHCYDKDELDYNPDILDEINKELSEKYYSPLDIISHRKKSRTNDNDPEGNEKTDYPYKLIKKGVSTFHGLNHYYKPWNERLYEKLKQYDFNDELQDNYNRTSVTAYMNFDNNGEFISIKTRVNGNYLLDHENYCCIRDTGSENYYNIEETREFKQCFLELRKMAYDELRKSDNIYNDTKNFIRRSGARIIDGDLHVFSETFNFDNPLLNEYYLLDYCNGQYKMTVSKQSRFLKLFLPQDIYNQKYGKVSDKIIAEYDPIKNTFIISDKKANLRNSAEFINECRLDYYYFLKELVDSHISIIREKNSIRGYSYSEYISEAPELLHKQDTIAIFHAENEFQCSINPDVIKIYAYFDLQKEIDNAPDIESLDTLHIISESIDIFNYCLNEIVPGDYIHEYDNLHEIYIKIKDYLDSQSEKPDFAEGFLDTYDLIKKYISKGFINKRQLKLAHFKSFIKDGHEPYELFYNENFTLKAHNELFNIQKKNYSNYVEKTDMPLSELVKDEKLYNKIRKTKFLTTITEIENPSPTFTLSDGNQIELSVEDLFGGFWLNLRSIEEIGQTILKHGSLNPQDLL